MIFIYTLPNRTPGISRRLARRLNCKILRHNRVPTAFKRGDFLINYGSSTEPEWSRLLRFAGVKIVNHWLDVKASANKLTTFRRLKSNSVPTLEFTSDRIKAAQWGRVIVRATLCGTKGQGITIIEKPKGDIEKIPVAPLYTRYWNKTHEYRVHVFNGEVIDFTQKKLLSKEEREKRGIDNKRLIRSYNNGWIFSRENIKHDLLIEQVAIDATKALQLDFCGVDILANWDGDDLVSVVVCETNAAPGMVKSTLDAYVSAFKQLKDVA